MSQVRPARARKKARRRPSSTIALRVSLNRTGMWIGPEAFWWLCRENPDMRLERTAKGELIAMPPAGSESGMRNFDLTTQLGVWSKADGRGVGFDSSAGFTLPDGAVRAPDAAWIVRERWEAVPPPLRKRFAPICPDFVVELTSPSDKRLDDLRLKMRRYLKNGARLGWLLDPPSGLVEVYRPDRAMQAFDRPATISGEDVLPGFALDLRGILFD